ncbi:MAG TPA: heme-binding protein [Pyrinomonadaceae bacterium]|nr:heme-binding protein [Pyrinomonadaceae bacterium]
MKALLRTIAAAAVLTATAVTAGAQVNNKKALNLEGARRVIAAAVAEARRLNAPGGVIAVVDDGGNLVALERMDGTFTAGANISVGKAKTAVMFKRPTRFFEDVIRNGRTAMVALPDFTPLQGGVPVEFEGQIVGGVGVSGAASAQQDEEIALAGANAFKQAGAASGANGAGANGAAVSFFESGAVGAAFERGSVLVGEGEGRNYMVHASRRERPGMAEVHELDTDIIYVLDGAATFVTGGAVVGGGETAPHEVRGASIEGGETRQLRRGDVITVPRGTPHWFKEVRAPFLYYVVKVR